MPKWWPGGGSNNPEGKYYEYDPNEKPPARGGAQGRSPTTEHIVEGLLRNAPNADGVRIRDLAKRVGELRDGQPLPGDDRRLQHQVGRILRKFRDEGKVEQTTGEPTGERGSPPSLWTWIMGDEKRPEWFTRNSPEYSRETRETGRSRHGENKGVPDTSLEDRVRARREARYEEARRKREEQAERARLKREDQAEQARARREGGPPRTRRGKWGSTPADRPSNLDPLGDLLGTNRKPHKPEARQPRDTLGDLLGTNKGKDEGPPDDEGGGLGIFRKA